MILKFNFRTPVYLVRQPSSTLLFVQTNSQTKVDHLKCLATKLSGCPNSILVHNQTRLLSTQSRVLWQKMKEENKEASSIIQSEAKNEVSTHHSPIKKGKKNISIC
jgi:hypothetical protein